MAEPSRRQRGRRAGVVLAVAAAVTVGTFLTVPVSYLLLPFGDQVGDQPLLSVLQQATYGPHSADAKLVLDVFYLFPVLLILAAIAGMWQYLAAPVVASGRSRVPGVLQVLVLGIVQLFAAGTALLGLVVVIPIMQTQTISDQDLAVGQVFAPGYWICIAGLITCAVAARISQSAVLTPSSSLPGAARSG